MRPGDYAGATIGIRPSGIERETFEALGARAQPYPAGSLAGLDGADLDVSTIAGNHYEKQARELTTNVVFSPRALVIVMNREKFDALTGAQQAVLRSAGRAAVEPHLASLDRCPGLARERLPAKRAPTDRCAGLGPRSAATCGRAGLRRTRARPRHAGPDRPDPRPPARRASHRPGALREAKRDRFRSARPLRRALDALADA